MTSIYAFGFDHPQVTIPYGLRMYSWCDVFDIDDLDVLSLSSHSMIVPALYHWKIQQIVTSYDAYLSNNRRKKNVSKCCAHRVHVFIAAIAATSIIIWGLAPAFFGVEKILPRQIRYDSELACKSRVSNSFLRSNWEHFHSVMTSQNRPALSKSLAASHFDSEQTRMARKHIRKMFHANGRRTKREEARRTRGKAMHLT